MLRIRRELEARGRRGELVRVTLRERLAQSEGFLASVEVVTTQVWEGLGRSMKKVARELPKLPGAVERGFSPHADDFMRGLEFGTLAAAVVFWEAKKIAFRHASKTFKDTTKSAEIKNFIQTRLSMLSRVENEMKSAKKLAEDIGTKIVKIKTFVYGE